MASSGNSYANPSDDFTGQWEDIQSYTSVVITIEPKWVSEVPSEVTLEWYNGQLDDGYLPQANTVPLAVDSFRVATGSPVTKEFSTRARWFRLKATQLKQISVNYKKAPTEIRIVDNSASPVWLNIGASGNSLDTVLTDASGVILKNTGSIVGQALYTTLADNSAFALGTTDSRYRAITRSGKNIFHLVSTTEAMDASALSTVLLNQNAFRLPRSAIPFRDGDIVNFSVWDACSNSISSNANGIMSVINEGLPYSSFTMNQGLYTWSQTNVNEQLVPRAKVKYLSVDNSFVTFQCLTEANTSSWFDPQVGLAPDYDVEDAAALALEAGVSGWFRPGADNTKGYLQFVHPDISQSNPLFSAKQFSSIVSSANGFNQTANVYLTGSDFVYPFDMRLIFGSLTGSAYLATELVTAYNPLESLNVALRDSSNANLGSTGVRPDIYKLDKRHTPAQNILFMVEATENYAVPGDASAALHQVVKGSIATAMQLIGRTTDLPADWATDCLLYVNQTGGTGGSDVYVPRRDNLNVLHVRNVIDPSWGIGAANNDVLQPSYGTSTGANYWGALGWLADTSYVDIQPIGSYDTIVLVIADPAKVPADQEHYYQRFFAKVASKTRRIVVTPYVTADALQIASSPSDVFLYGSTVASLTAVGNQIGEQLVSVKYDTNNALYAHPANKSGVSQAGTQDVCGAAFGDVALYYSLSDASGLTIASTATATEAKNNAVYVTLADQSGKSINDNNRLFVTIQPLLADGHTFSLAVSAGPVTLVDLSGNSGLNHDGFNVHGLEFANETPVPVWVRVYDACVGFVRPYETSLGLPGTAVAMKEKLKFNFAVPGLNFRDIHFAQPVYFQHGVYFAASTDFRYESYDYSQPRPIYVTGNYNVVTKGTQ